MATLLVQIFTHQSEVTAMQTAEERRDALNAEINQLCRESLQRAKQFLKDMDNKWYEVHWGEAHLKRTERVMAEHNAWEEASDARMAALEEELEKVQ
jgi:hypothetical protein